MNESKTTNAQSEEEQKAKALKESPVANDSKDRSRKNQSQEKKATAAKKRKSASGKTAATRKSELEKQSQSIKKKRPPRRKTGKTPGPSIDRDALRKASASHQPPDDDLADEEFVGENDDSWNLATEDDVLSAASQQRKPDIVDGIGSLLGGVKSISSSAIKLAREKTVDSAARMIQQSPEQLERMARAGRSLQDLRDVTGVSIEEVAGAIDLKNPGLLRAVEEGKAALPFEILLRLSSFYARNNPVPFILKYARTYNPLISKTLEKIGIDKLVIEAEREIQFVQILRSRDAARELSDEDFQRVLLFTEKAFDMALNFAAREEDEER